MSDDTRQVEEPSIVGGSVLELLEDWYHVPVLAVTLAFMLWVRVQSYERFFRNGQVYLSGNDAYYHLRQVQYTVNNWPATMPFDPWTGFPVGTSVGQFGTLYDQLIATAALVVGLGSPTGETVATVLLFAPPVFGMLVAVPTYFIGKRLGGRLSGVVAALLMALLPGTILQRSLVGSADHNIAEPFFQAFAVLAMMVAVAAAERERPIYEQVVDREFASLRRPLGFGVIAGFATAAYLWVWPPGVILMAIFGVFFVLKLSADFVRGVSPDHLAFVGAVSMAVVGFLSLVALLEPSFSATAPTLLQPALAFTIAAGVVFMAWLGREWESRDLSPWLYPVTVAVLIAAAVLAVRLGFPGLYDSVTRNLGRIVIFVRRSAEVGTVAEARTMFDQATRFNIAVHWAFYLEYGLALFTAILAVLVMFGRAIVGSEHRGERLLVVIWFAFLTSMAFTQIRFNYYLAVPVAALNGYLVYEVLRFVGGARLTSDLGEVEWYQVLSVVMVVMLVGLPLVASETVGSENQVQFSTAMEVGSSAGPDGVRWSETLHWMRDNTPIEGTFAGADNEMAYYGSFDRTDDFDYPAGSYGVMSWWDYGHWITLEAERIPNANPFQQHATAAANFLLAPNETAAEEVRQSLSEDDAETRYVLVDWQMVSPTSKFRAPTIFYDAEDGTGPADFYTRVYQQTQQGAQTRLFLKHQRYYESMMIRLYRYHGSAMQPNPDVVIDYQPVRGTDGNTYLFAPQGNRSILRSFDTMAEAREFVEGDGSAQLGGIGPYPSEYVPALEHYRLIQVSAAPAPQSVQFNDPRLSQTPTWVKAFERVPGATVEGEGPPNATVTASVQLSVPNRDSTFVYTQHADTDADGSFEMTLPYASTGYDEFGPANGYTNVSVRATGPYSFSTRPTFGGGENLTLVQWSDTADVHEANVLGVDESPVEVALEREVIDRPGGANNSTAPANDSGESLSPPDAPADSAADGRLDAGDGPAVEGDRQVRPAEPARFATGPPA